MLYTPLSVVAAELVLCVNQGARFSKLRRRRAEQRALSRSLSRAAARIERTTEYRLSLEQVLEHNQRFQLELDAGQKERWLALEDALLEHTAKLNHAYYREGADFGSRLGWRLQRGHGSLCGRSLCGRSLCGRSLCGRGERAASARDAELIVALAGIIAKLAVK